MDFDIDGLDDLIKEIDQIKNLSEELKDDALVKGGDVLKDEMKDEVYRHGLDRITGQAEDSIIRTDPEHGELYVGTQGGKRQPGFYLYMHEFGYFNVWAQRFIAPKPFASIAFKQASPKVLDAYVDVFQKGLKMK